MNNRLADRESERLGTLARLGILDTPPEERFDRLTRLAQRVFGLPVALINFVDHDRHWFKSCQGLDAPQMTRPHSMCNIAVASTEPLIVPDVQRDERFNRHPNVSGSPNIGFYAGCAIKAPNGVAVGSFCLADFRPHPADRVDPELLKDFAALAERELGFSLLHEAKDLQEKAFSAIAENETVLRTVFEHARDFIYIRNAEGTILYANQAVADAFDVPHDRLAGMSLGSIFTDAELLQDMLEDDGHVIRTGERGRREWQLTFPDGTEHVLEVDKSRLVLPDGTTMGVFVVAHDITELRRSERRIRDSEERLAEAQEIAQLGSWSWEVATNRIVWSDQMFRMFGIEPEAFGATLEAVLELLHPADRRELEDLVSTCLQERRDVRVDYRVIVPGGELRYFHSNMRPLLGDDGTVLRLSGTNQDVTELRNSELLLRESESKIRAIVDHTQDAIFIKDGAGRFVFVNKAAAEDLGLEVGEAIGRSAAEFADSLEAEKMLAGERYVMETGKGIVNDWSIVGTDGRVRVMSAAKYPFVVDGKTQGIVGIARDITARTEAEAALIAKSKDLEQALAFVNFRNEQIESEIAERTRELAHEKALVDQIFQNAPAAIAYLDRDLVIRMANPACRTLLDLPPDQILDRHIYELFPRDPAHGEGAVRRVLDGGEAVFVREFRPSLRLADGSERAFWDATFVPVFDAERRVSGLFAFVVDVSDRVEKARLQAQQIEALQEADHLKDEFLNNLSHELRTPLTTIVGAANLLDNDMLGPINPKQRQYLHKLQVSAEILIDLLNDLLDVSLIQAGKFSLIPRQVDLEGLVRSRVDSVRSLADNKHQTLELVMAGDLPEIVADDRRVGQVLVNLLNNAIKFTPAKGRIQVRVHHASGFLRCEVEDDGPGIEPADQPKLFQRFVQLGDPLNKPRGTGLGLSICKALVDAHGGAIGVRSQPGEGSVFWFTLPV